MHWLGAAALAGVCALGVAAAEPTDRAEAAAPMPADDAGRWDALAHRVAALPEVPAAAGRFTQEKRTPLLRRPVTSHGTVRFAPGAVRWDTLEPHPSTMLIHRGRVELFLPQQRTLEVFPAPEALPGAALGQALDVDALRQRFTLTELDDADGQTLRFVLTARDGDDQPTQAAAGAGFDRVALTLDAATGLPQRVQLDGEAESLVITFEALTPQPALDAAALRLEVPAGTKVVDLQTAGRPGADG
jgi:outer membrane lipoprotein-sorting protein